MDAAIGGGGGGGSAAPTAGAAVVMRSRCPLALAHCVLLLVVTVTGCC